MLRAVAKELVDRLIPPSLLIRRVRTSERRVALTFDDGPDDLTRKYLDLLDELEVYATFFVMGDQGSLRPDDLLEIVRRGHEVASHGFSHTPFTELSRTALRQELQDTAAVLPPMRRKRAFVRPPYGAVDAAVLVACAQQGYTTALWSVDSMDSATKDPAEIARAVSPERVRPGDVILLHEGQPWTLEAVPTIVGQLRDAGYEVGPLEALAPPPL